MQVYHHFHGNLKQKYSSSLYTQVCQSVIETKLRRASEIACHNFRANLCIIVSLRWMKCICLASNCMDKCRSLVAVRCSKIICYYWFENVQVPANQLVLFLHYLFNVLWKGSNLGWSKWNTICNYLIEWSPLAHQFMPEVSKPPPFYRCLQKHWRGLWSPSPELETMPTCLHGLVWRNTYLIHSSACSWVDALEARTWASSSSSHHHHQHHPCSKLWWQTMW